MTTLAVNGLDHSIVHRSCIHGIARRPCIRARGSPKLRQQLKQYRIGRVHE
jgi:hypothetical protein